MRVLPRIMMGRAWMPHTGLLFLPDDFDASKKYPTLVFSSTMAQINELLGSHYAKKMAERGYVFFTFDHIGIEDTKEALRDAVHYLGTLDFVDTVHVDHTTGTLPGLHG